jgi:hypothetical protein
MDQQNINNFKKHAKQNLTIFLKRYIYIYIYIFFKNYINICIYIYIRAALHIYDDSSGRTVQGVGLRPLACWDCGFESYRGHGGLSVVSVVCCQVEVCATG